MTKNDTLMQVVALSAMAAAVAVALWIGGPDDGAATSHDIEAATFWADVETGDDHVDPVDLARRILAGKERIAIVDVRPAEEFAQFHLRGAVSMSVPDLVGARGEALLARGDDLVVVCSNGPAHPAQAWVELRRKGHDNVRVLDGGLDAMKRSVFTPPSLAADVDASTAASRRTFVELARHALLARDGEAPAKGSWSSDPVALELPSMVSPRWVASRLGDVVVVDVRSRVDFEQLHAPQAAHVAVAQLRDRHGDRELMLLPAEILAERFSQMGLSMETPVAIVADRMHDAAFAALAFLRTGHRKVAVVEGGMRAWAQEGLPLTAEIATRAPTQHGFVQGADDFTMSVDELAQFVRDGRGVVIDSRPVAQFEGREGQEARQGHVPGAKNRPLAKDFDRATGLLADRATTEAAYAALGADAATPVALMCRTGHQAAQQFFVLRWLLGRENVKWCNGSFTLWAERADLPVVPGGEQ